MSHIFISYSSQDIDFVRYLRTLLESEGFGVWVDEARLSPGAGWWRDIEQSIERCAAFFVVMSPSARESDWVEREILLAEDRKKPVYPILFSGSPWSRLANIQYEDMRAGLHASLSPRLLFTLREKITPRPAPTAGMVDFVVEHGNVVSYAADVLALKYARGFHGADAAVVRALNKHTSIADTQIRPEVGEYMLLDTEGGIGAPLALFLGTTTPRQFAYEEIRKFSTSVLHILSQEAPDARHLAMTLHGPNAGHDEVEALLSQFAGCYEGIQSGAYPPGLRQITLVEKDEDRVKRLRLALDTALVKGETGALPHETGWRLPVPDANTDAEPMPVELASTVKPHAFVAMPPSSDMDDVFYYGIQLPIHALGLLCERLGEETPADDALDYARQSIDTASVVVADLTGAHPAVCLQLGYAWGKARPTILLTKDGESLPVAVRGQPVLTYQRIKEAEEQLARALSDLKAEGLL